MSRRLPALLVAALLASVLAAAPAFADPAAGDPAAGDPAAGDPGPVYRPPADAPVLDPFRPPDHPYGPGNRGIELGTRPGDDVSASGAGEVVFAGPVAGALHVVVAHADGLRTSYSFLGSVSVAEGDDVAAGQRIGRAGGPTHFGVRAGEAYLDPEALFDEPLRVWLVPHEGVTDAEESARRRVVDRLFDEPDVVAAVGRGVAWARGAAATAVDLAQAELEGLRQELRTYVHYAYELNALVHVGRAAQAAHRWWDHRDECTPEATPAPPPPPERRIVVLVAGLNSSSVEGAVDDVDTAALGYADADVVRFSYAGGRAPYEPDDTRHDIRRSGRLLLDLLRDISAASPGVPVDVIAHSQGGLVARVAMDELDPLDPRNPDIGHLVTLGTPHHGADLATAAGQVARSGVGDQVLTTVDAAADLGLSPHHQSVAQMSETSAFIADLNDGPPPDHVEITSIAARTDVVVPAGRSHVQGATNVIVGVDGLTAHDDLPGSDEAQRELALALGGLGPTCDDFATWMLDHTASDAIGWAEDWVGLTASVAARRADARVPGPRPAPTRTPGPVRVGP